MYLTSFIFEFILLLILSWSQISKISSPYFDAQAFAKVAPGARQIIFTVVVSQSINSGLQSKKTYDNNQSEPVNVFSNTYVNLHISRYNDIPTPMNIQKGWN